MPRPRLTLDIAFLTSRGIAVVDVDYGGSTGYGRAYRRRLEGAWGIVDVDDCVAAARFLVERGDVDPERLAIEGGSAGGYTTLAALAFRDVFAAGISEFGIGDLETLARDTHKFESRYMDRLVGPYPEAAATYRERSPIHYLDEITCPVLVLQGLDDKVVPPSQAEAIVAALAANGIPHAYLASRARATASAARTRSGRRSRPELAFLGAVFGFTPADDVRAARPARPRGVARAARPPPRDGVLTAARTHRPQASTRRRPWTLGPIELVLLLLVVATALAYVARRIGVAYPILLVLGGRAALGFVLGPDLPAELQLEPDLVFLLFLPPILFGAGYFTPIRDFKANARPILLLAIGLVLFTTVVVGVVASALDPGAEPAAAAFALGRHRGAAGRGRRDGRSSGASACRGGS